MGLKIYDEVKPDSFFSTGGTFENPLSLSFNGTSGEIIQKRYYVRNDDANYYYEGITIQPVDNGDNIVDGTGVTEGFMWQLIAGDQQPLEAQWDPEITEPGASIVLGDIGSSSDGDIRSYIPFWLRITIPRGVAIKSYQGVTLKISASEGLVL